MAWSQIFSCSVIQTVLDNYKWSRCICRNPSLRMINAALNIRKSILSEEYEHTQDEDKWDRVHSARTGIFSVMVEVLQPELSSSVNKQHGFISNCTNIHGFTWGWGGTPGISHPLPPHPPVFSWSLEGHPPPLLPPL